ncbi:hypothetical protein Q8F55_008545 [Vanrija albida]|uniref:Uncharacterized protein n=1 Tax=Vanrija albida TaxID=181172 RepID=A0ABR3PR50_9TREE
MPFSAPPLSDPDGAAAQRMVNDFLNNHSPSSDVATIRQAMAVLEEHMFPPAFDFLEEAVLGKFMRQMLSMPPAVEEQDHVPHPPFACCADCGLYPQDTASLEAINGDGDDEVESGGGPEVAASVGGAELGVRFDDWARGDASVSEADHASCTDKGKADGESLAADRPTQSTAGATDTNPGATSSTPSASAPHGNNDPARIERAKVYAEASAIVYEQLHDLSPEAAYTAAYEAAMDAMDDETDVEESTGFEYNNEFDYALFEYDSDDKYVYGYEEWMDRLAVGAEIKERVYWEEQAAAPKKRKNKNKKNTKKAKKAAPAATIEAPSGAHTLHRQHRRSDNVTGPTTATGPTAGGGKTVKPTPTVNKNPAVPTAAATWDSNTAGPSNYASRPKAGTQH